MKTYKYYFCEVFGDEFAYSKEVLIEKMKDEGLKEVEIREAIREVGSDYFFCKKFGEVGLKDENDKICGKICDKYKPKNGKSGCCVYRGYCYEPSDEVFRLDLKGHITSLSHFI